MLLLENVRFYKEEEKNDIVFAKDVRGLAMPFGFAQHAAAYAACGAANPRHTPMPVRQHAAAERMRASRLQPGSGRCTLEHGPHVSAWLNQWHPQAR